MRPAPSRDELLALAERVLRLTVSRRDPEQFHIDRDLIAKALRAMAQRAEAGAMLAPRNTNDIN
jgi:hypothetical protein